MDTTASFNRIAALIGDRARVDMLTALMAGRALTATELADHAGVARPTASAHLAALTGAGLLEVEKQGRHRYFRLANEDVAGLLEGLMGVAHRIASAPVSTGPVDPALRQARACYDHLAGALGAALLERYLELGWLRRRQHSRALAVTARGQRELAAFTE